MEPDSDSFFDPLDIPGPEIVPRTPSPPVPEPEPEQAPQEIAPSATVEPSQQITHVEHYNFIPIKLNKEVEKEKQELLNESIKDAILFGSEATAMYCRGEGDADNAPCPVLDKCPIFRKLGRAHLPVGDPCPVEEAIIKNYVYFLAKEMEIDINDPANHYDLSVIAQRAALKILMHRATIFMGEQPLLERIIETDNGKFVTKLAVGNMNVDYFLRALAEDRKLAESALLTRRSKVATLKSGFKDRSKHAAELQTRIRRQIDSTERKIVMDPITGLPSELTEITKFSREKPPDGP